VSPTQVRRQAIQDACQRYGLKTAFEDGNLSAAIAHYPLKQKATDPLMERQRWRSGIDSAFNAAETFDRPTGNISPTPDFGGTINRVEG
jgi:hypothetical protein